MQKILLILILLTVATAVAIFLFSQQDERQIRRNIASLSATISRSMSRDGIGALAEIYKIGAFFTDDCQIVVGDPIPEIHGRGALIAAIYQVRKIVAGKIEVAFRDVSVTIEENRVTAISIKTAIATGVFPDSGAPVKEIRDIEMHWEKTEKGWKIAEAKAIPILY